MISLQAKTAGYFRKEGFVVAPVEAQKRFPDRSKPTCEMCGTVPEVMIRHDLWNCFDLLACRPDPPRLVLIQTTSSAHHAIRRTKVLTSPEARFWLMAGGDICIQSWRKDEHNRWRSRTEWLMLEHFPRSMPATAAELYESRRRERLPVFPRNTTLFKEVPF